MRWTPGGTSGDIEDRRGMGGLRPMHIGWGGLLLLLLLSLIFNQDFVSMFTGGAGVGSFATEAVGGLSTLLGLSSATSTGF